MSGLTGQGACGISLNGRMRDLDFIQCERGFLFREAGFDGSIPKCYAFDTVEDAAAWLVERYSQPA